MLLSFFRRRQVITHWKEQSRLASVFLFWSLILVAILLGLFFINYASIRADAGPLTINDQAVARMLLVDQARQLALWYGGCILLYLILVAGYVLAYSHRITGPIHKLNIYLKKATHNKAWPEPLSFRKNDGFHDLADNFNKFLEAMQETSKTKSADKS